MPVPPALLEALDLVHGIRELQSRRGKGRGIHLWPWSRMTGWRAVHAVMEAAGLDGPHASPKGLRHGFGVAAVSAGIPLNLVLVKGVQISGFQFQDLAPDEFARNDEELRNLLVSGRVAPHIGVTFPLAETASALRHVADGKAIGKVLIDLDSGT